MNRLITTYRPRNVFDGWERAFDNFFDRSQTAPRRSRSPRVDVREVEDRYLLEAELPGLTEADLEVTVNDNLLTIASRDVDGEATGKEVNGNTTDTDGTASGSDTDATPGWLVHERTGTSFSRSFVLPRDADPTKVEATLTNGLLALAVHKLERARPRQIDIKHA